MRDDATVYVRMIEGSTCLVPVNAQRRHDGLYLLGANSDFDPEDTATLLEFLPGDVVRVALRQEPGGAPAIAIATHLVSSQVPDRDYWAVLFALVDKPGAIPRLDDSQLEQIAARVRTEVASGSRWHYPGVIEWVRKRAGMQDA
jgi:hypothetical protein